MIRHLDDAIGQAHWTANAVDAEQHLTQQTVGNGLITTNSFGAPMDVSSELW